MESQPGRMLQDEALEAALANGGPVVLPIAGGDRSMEPTLSGGDAVLAVPISGSLVPGEILVYRQRDYLVVHRYLGRARAADGTPCLRTRGDGRRELDPPLAEADVRARVAAVRRAGVWRSTGGGAARLYARLIGLHDLFWAGATHLSGRVGLAGVAGVADRALLGAATAVLFAAAHPVMSAPGGAERGVSV